MKSDKKQTLIFIGIALAVIGIILIIYAVALPRVYTEIPAEAPATTAVQTTMLDEQATDTLQVNYPLDINTATAEELATVDGIGTTRANAIIEYREYLGGYTSVEQIMDIEGFGESVYAQIAPYLTVE